MNIGVFFKEMYSLWGFLSMCGQPIYLARAVLTVIDFFPVWYSAHRTLGASLMKHRPTVAYFSPAVSGRLSLASEKGETAGENEHRKKKSQPIISHILRVSTVKINQKNSDSYSLEGVCKFRHFILFTRPIEKSSERKKEREREACSYII